MLKGFADRREGSVAIVFGLALVAVVLAAGLVLDFTMLSRARVSIQQAADQAALSYAKSYMQSGGDEDAAKADAIAAFNANITSSGLGVPAMAEPRLVRDAKGVVSAVEVDFSSTLPMRFAGLAGFDARSVAGTAEVAIGSVGGSIAIVVDTSDSMGLAATPVDRDAMRALYHNCEFACHMPEASVGPENPLTIARDNDIELRIDVARKAVTRMLDTFVSRPDASKLKIGLYAFNHDLYTLQTVATGTPALARSASAGLDLGTGVGPSEYTRTDYDAVFAAMKTEFAPSDPADAATIMMITDGVHSRVHGAPFTEVKPIDTALCQDMKDRGHIIAVIYTRYLEAKDSMPFLDQVDPFYDQIEPNLKACATPGYFAHGDTPSEIEAAVRQISRKLESVYLSR